MVVLYTGNQPQTADLYRNALEGEKLVLVDDQALDMTIEQLAALDHDLISGQPGSLTPFIFVTGNDQADAQRILSSMAEKFNPLPDMAMETADNKPWTFKALLEEIEKEKAYFAMREELYDLIRNMSRERVNNDPAYAQTIMEGYMLLKAPQAEPEDVERILNALKA